MTVRWLAKSEQPRICRTTPPDGKRKKDSSSQGHQTQTSLKLFLKPTKHQHFLIFVKFYKLFLCVCVCISARQRTNALLKRTLIANHFHQDHLLLLDKPSNFSRFISVLRSFHVCVQRPSQPVITTSTFKMSFERFPYEKNVSSGGARWFYLPAGRSSASQCRFCDTHGSGIHNCLVQPVSGMSAMFVLREELAGYG